MYWFWLLGGVFLTDKSKPDFFQYFETYSPIDEGKPFRAALEELPNSDLTKLETYFNDNPSDYAELQKRVIKQEEFRRFEFQRWIKDWREEHGLNNNEIAQLLNNMANDEDEFSPFKIEVFRDEAIRLTRGEEGLQEVRKKAVETLAEINNKLLENSLPERNLESLHRLLKKGIFLITPLSKKQKEMIKQEIEKRQ